MSGYMTYLCELQTQKMRMNENPGFIGSHYKASKNSLYPTEVSLLDKMPPVYNQALRGTCVANATTALVEYFEGCKSRLSVQFLYQLIKDWEKTWYYQNSQNLLNGEDVDAEFACLYNGAISREKANMRAAKIQTLMQMKKGDKKSSFSLEEQQFINSISEEDGKIIKQRALASLAPEFDNGTTIHHAFIALKQFGICRYELCPYSRIHTEENLTKKIGLADFSDEVYRDAKKHIITAGDLYVLPTPNNVDELKGILSGANNRRPMPVCIGVTIFPFMQKELPQDRDGYGIVGLPHIVYITNGEKNENGEFVIVGTELSENSIGGHEMLLVGYKDEDGWAGGGYFLVRNSWGEGWGTEGYCKIPYAYIECFCDEAGTILQNMCDYEGDGSYENGVAHKGKNGAGKNPLANIPEELKPYARVADKDMKDRAGIYRISKGMIILVDEDGIADVDSVENRAIFIKNGCSWSAPKEIPTKSRKEFLSNAMNMFDESLALGDESKSGSLEANDVDVAMVVRQEFLTQLDKNLTKKSKSYCFPNINLPALSRLLPWQIKVSKVEVCDDLSVQFVSAMQKDGLLSEADIVLAKKLNVCKIYNLSNGGVRFYVAAVFVASIKGGEVEKKLTPKHLDCIKKFLAEYYECMPNASCKFHVIGSFAKWNPTIPAMLGRNESLIFCHKEDADINAPWQISLPDVHGGAVWYGFIRHLLPTHKSQRLAALKMVIKDIQLEDGGHVTLTKIAERLNLPPQLAIFDIDALCREGGWRYNNEILTVDANRKPGKGIVAVRDTLVFGYWNNLMSAIFTAIGWWICVSADMSNRYKIGTIAGLALFSFLGSLFSAENLRKVIGIEKE